MIPDEYTTDGKCHGNIFCGSWAGGPCCHNGQCGTMCDASAGCTSGCTAQSASNPSTGTAPPVTTADDDDNYAPEDYIPCDYTKTFHNLDDLNAASAGLRSQCLAAHAMQTLITMLDTAYDNYNSVNNGYDNEFANYVTYVKKLVPTVLDKSFMFNVAKETLYEPISPPGPGMSCEYSTNWTVAKMPDADCIH